MDKLNFKDFAKNIYLAKKKVCIFEGGGVNGVGYIGTLKIFDKLDPQFLTRLQHVGGTSAGAIISLLVALNLSIDNIEKELAAIKFSSFADGPKWRIAQAFRLLSCGYINEGNAIDAWLVDLCQRYQVAPDLSFKQMLAKGYKSLHVFATLSDNDTLLKFDPYENGDTRVLDAVRMSMSIPLYFKPVKLVGLSAPLQGYRRANDLESDTALTVTDGGMLANYPWQQVADQIKAQTGKVDFEQFIGAMVEDHNMILYFQGKRQLPDKPMHGFWAMLKSLIGIMFYSQRESFKQNAEAISNTAMVETTLASTDFSLSASELQALVNAGENAAVSELCQAYHAYLQPEQQLANEQVEAAQCPLPNSVLAS